MAFPLFNNCFYYLTNSTTTEAIFPLLERQMDQITNLLASRVMYMCTLLCKTGTCLIMDQTMKLLARELFICTLRCKTMTCLAMDKTMKLLTRVLFTCTLRYKTGIYLTWIKLRISCPWYCQCVLQDAK